MSKITLTLKFEEKQALLELADEQRRDPHEQAALFIREALEARGLLNENNKSDVKTSVGVRNG